MGYETYSARVAFILRKKGCKNVYVITDGINGLMKGGFWWRAEKNLIKRYKPDGSIEKKVF